MADPTKGLPTREALLGPVVVPFWQILLLCAALGAALGVLVGVWWQ